MRKIITLPILLIAFVACNSDCPNSITVKQREFLKSKIELNTEKLLVKVEETGYSPAGKKFIEICNSVNAQTQAIIEAIEKGERIAEDDIAELINATNYK